MIRSGEKITTASTLCGYEYFSTFYRNFKEIMGIPPSEYQRTE
jgi:AraC-like DNA-binding protein